MSIVEIMYREIAHERGEDSGGFPSLKEVISPYAQDYEDRIVNYLATSPNYSALGKVVGDVLERGNGITLYPGTNTDGRYLWPCELAFYVRKYHVRLPKEFLEHMASLAWQPPRKGEIDWDLLYKQLDSE